MCVDRSRRGGREVDVLVRGSATLWMAATSVSTVPRQLLRRRSSSPGYSGRQSTFFIVSSTSRPLRPQMTTSAPMAQRNFHRRATELARRRRDDDALAQRGHPVPSTPPIGTSESEQVSQFRSTVYPSAVSFSLHPARGHSPAATVANSRG